MARSLLNAYKWLNQYPGWVFGIGILGIFFTAYRQWKHLSEHRSDLDKEALPHLPKLTEFPRVSLLIPAWNESLFITQCLSSALELRYPNKEIIVCAGGQDRTYLAAKTLESQGVIMLEQTPGMGKQKALESCFEHSTGDIIYLTDADCILEDSSFEATISPIVSGQESVTTGYFEPFPEERSNWLVEYQWRQHAEWQHNRYPYTSTLDGRNCAIKREVLEAVQGFSVSASIGTDYTLSKLITSHSYRIRSLPYSRVKTHYPGTIPEYLRQLSRWFRNRLTIGLRYQARDDVITSLRAGGSSTIILGMPLLYWLSSPLFFSLWSLLAIRSILQNWLVLTAYRPKDEPVLSANRLKMTLQGTSLNLIGMARGFLESLLPGYNQNW